MASINVQRPNLKEATLFPTLLSLANSKLNGKIVDKILKNFPLLVFCVRSR
jgi:hypothetical protein